MAWNAPADSRAFGSSAITTGIGPAPKNWSTQQDKLGGYWQGALVESDKVLATSFAVLVPGQGAGAGLDQQAAPCPRRTTGTTIPTTSAIS